MLFQRDIFSDLHPGWSSVSKAVECNLGEVLSCLPASFLPLLSEPEQSGALCINSSNFRLNTSRGTFLLKRWSPSAKAADLSKTLELMEWLALRKLPVPKPIEFPDGKFLLSLDSGAWSLFPFIEGEYFSGVEDELDAAAEMTGRLMDTLSQLPSNQMPGIGPRHLTAEDDELLRRVEHNSGRWVQLFGSTYADLLLEHWPVLVMEWDRLIGRNLDAGPLQAAHFDLHPHNILVRSQFVTAVLDFESCKLMPVGYALSFAALKQCRQAVSLSNLSSADAALVGTRYVNGLVDCCPSTRSIVNRLGDLAVSEVLRRICLILRLNLESDNKTWNHVLPTQLRHIGEARALFGT